MSFTRPMLLALVVACGIAIAWFFVAVWTLALVQSATQINQVREDLYVGVDGQPLIVRFASTPAGTVQETFSLDREPVKVDAQRMGHPQYMIGPRYYSGLQQGINWRSRLAGASDGGSPAVYWYLVHDGRINGRAYGVGYHSRSELIVGYFGKQGFSERLPPRDEWFQVVGQHGLLHVGTLPIVTEPPWNPYSSYPGLVLLADGKVWIIDVAKRQLAAAADCPNALGVGWLQPPHRVQILGEPSDSRELLVWQTDRLLLIDRDSGEQTSLPLPADWRPAALGAYELPDHRLLLISMDPQRGDNGHAVAWLDREGNVTAQRRVQVDQYRGTATGPGPVVWSGAVAAPFPLASGFLAIVYPADRVASGQADSFLGELAELLRQTWPALLLVLAASGLAAADAYRRQRRYALPHPLGWAVFVFLLGLPGWLAHRLHRTWPALEPCPACQQPSPIDRPSCPDCGVAVPPPRLTGIEVWA